MQSVIKEMNNLNIPANLHIPLKTIKKEIPLLVQRFYGEKW
jgi:hypothetical protein